MAKTIVLKKHWKTYEQLRQIVGAEQNDSEKYFGLTEAWINQRMW